MTNNASSEAIKKLKELKAQTVTEIARLQMEAKTLTDAIKTLESGRGNTKPTRVISVEGRAKIAAAQKKRWAKPDSQVSEKPQSLTAAAS